MHSVIRFMTADYHALLERLLAATWRWPNPSAFLLERLLAATWRRPNPSAFLLERLLAATWTRMDSIY
jgi:hypothetical protein